MLRRVQSAVAVEILFFHLWLALVGPEEDIIASLWLNGTGMMFCHDMLMRKGESGDLEMERDFCCSSASRCLNLARNQLCCESSSRKQIWP